MATGQATQERNSSAIIPLPKRADFLRLRSGRKRSGKYFTLQASPSAADGNNIRVGLTVTTKVGNAVVRNRIKRRLRSAVGQVFAAVGCPGHDYVIIARRPTLRAEFSALLNELTVALDHVHGKGAKGTRKPHGSRDRAS